MKNIDFLIFEKDIINAILRANDNTQILMKQYAVACVKQRIYTGVGFYTDYEVMDDSLRVSNESLRLGGIEVEIAEIPNGCDFILYVENGMISCLEGYTYADPWPEHIKKYKIVDKG